MTNQAKRKVKRVLIGALAVTNVVLAGAYYVQGEDLTKQIEEKDAQINALMDDVIHAEYVLDEYKAVYDGLELFEDGSWTYKDGVDEYYFWNWDLQYVGK